jgi:cellobiose dehydrogenase (acceptor)
MRHPSSLAIIFLLICWTTVKPARGASHACAGQYTNSDTGIVFCGYSDKSGYGFGTVMPEQPTTDFVAQIVSPLADGAGWAGVGFDSSMVGPLLLVTW